MIEGYYALLSTLFSPILGLPAIISELILAIIIIFIITLVYRFFVDQNKVRELKEKQKEMQEKVKELKKTNPDAANNMMNDILKLTNKQFRMNMKPFLLVFIIAIMFLPWMATVFKGPIAMLPFSLPFFENDFGWLMWYIVISLPINQLLRKFMGVE